MTTIVRGTMIFFSATLVDKDGNPATPSSANLYLVFKNTAGVRTSATIAMTLAGNVASAQWDSSVASDYVVRWTIKAVGSNTIVQDGSFTLTANESNPTS